MHMPTITGIIRRRILANFSVEPEVIARLLPAPFSPKIVNGRAVAGVCLIRLEQIRPLHTPAALGITSENAAHRIAVTWQDEEGIEREGVYVPRRDTDSLLNVLAGGRLFPGEHHRSDFEVSDDGDTVDLTMPARDGGTQVAIHAAAAPDLASSLFAAALCPRPKRKANALARVASAELQRRDAHAHHDVVEDARAEILACGAGAHHEREEVLLARVARPTGRGLAPLRERRVTVRRRLRRGGGQPRVERLRVLATPRGHEAPHVVVAHPATDDEHALVTKRRERAADREVGRRVEAGLE